MPKEVSRRHDERPSFPWYPKDWISDNGLTMCSYAAKGLWMDMLCRMWFSRIRGVLPGQVERLTRLFCSNASELTPLIEELEANHVFTRGKHVDQRLEPQAIVNRRMYKEWRISRLRQDAGRVGGSNGKNTDSNKQTPSKTQANAKQTPEQNAKQNASKISDVSNSNSNDLEQEQVSKTQANAKQKAKQNASPSRARASLSFSLSGSGLDLIKQSNVLALDRNRAETTEHAKHTETGGIASVGNLALPCLANLAPPVEQDGDTVALYVALINEATGGAFQWRRGHKDRLRRILGHQQGARLVDALIERVEASEDPSKGYDAIPSPGAFVNSGLMEIENDLGLKDKT